MYKNMIDFCILILYLATLLNLLISLTNFFKWIFSPGLFIYKII